MSGQAPNPTWGPLSKKITNITNAAPATVTTVAPHGFMVGLYVRFFFPAYFGMTPLAGNVYLVTSVPTSVTFTINADTTAYDPFTISTTKQAPQVIPIAEVSLTLLQAERNTSTPIGGGI